MNTLTTHRIATSICCFALTGISVHTADTWAEEPPQQEKSKPELEVIVVTAQKRSENALDVPIAMSVQTGDTLQALMVTNAKDLVDITPGLSARQQGGSHQNYFLRGVGTNDFHLTSAPAIGQYFDEVTLTSGFQGKASLFDMARVEILKGPQNTLFGLNTTGGAVNYISNKPDIGSGTSGQLNLRLGNYSLAHLDGAIGFDLNDSLAARISGSWTDHDGAFDSSFDGSDFSDENTKAARGHLLWQLTERTDALLNIHGATSSTNGVARRAMGSRAPDGSENHCPQFTNRVLNYEGNDSCVSRNAPSLSSGTGQSGVVPSGNDWRPIGSDLGHHDLDTHGAYLKISHEMGWAKFVSLTAFEHLDFQTASDLDGTDLALMLLFQQDDRDTWQQEFRLVSEEDDKFRWISGIFYLDEEANSYTGLRTRLPPLGGFATVPNVQLEHGKTNLSLYGQIEYDFTDDLTLTLGLRWSDEEITGNYLPSSPDVAAISAQQAFFAGDINRLVMEQGGFDPARQVTQKLTNEDTGFTVKLDQKLNQDSLVYASYSRGFKGGALDIRAAFALLPVPNIVAGLANSNLAPESLDAWELGYKTTLEGRNIELDAAAFYYDYSDLQQFITGNGQPILANAPESEIVGVDGNIRYANYGGFYLQAGLTYLDSEIKDGGDIFVDGVPLSNTPQWTAMAMLSQSFNVPNGSLTLQTNINYTDQRHVATLNDTLVAVDKIDIIDGYTLINASATYRFGESEEYSLGLYINNITDEHFCQDIRFSDGPALIADRAIFPPTGGTQAHTYTTTCAVNNATVRTYGITFGLSF